MPLFSLPYTVRFQDIDAAGIMFFPRVLEYFHDAYLAWLQHKGFNFPKHIQERIYGMPLVHAEADFRGPLRLGQKLELEVSSVEPGETSYAVTYRALDADTPTNVLAVGRTVHVCVDGTTFKPRPLPPELRNLMSPVG